MLKGTILMRQGFEKPKHVGNLREHRLLMLKGTILMRQGFEKPKHVGNLRE